MTDGPTPGHTLEFRDAAARPRADRTTLLAATLVAQTAIDLLMDPALVEAAWAGVQGGRHRELTGYDGRGAPRWTGGEPAAPRVRPRTVRLPSGGRGSGGARGRAPEPRPAAPVDVDFAKLNGWDRDWETFADYDLPTYVGPTTFMNLPWIEDPAELRARNVDVAIVGAPFDDAVSHRPGARFGPRAIREAQYTSGSIHSLQLGNEPFDVLTVVDAGDANIVPAWIERAHALIHRKVRDVAATGAIPIVLGGDHSITWPSATAIAEVRRPGSIGIVHFDAHADTANDDWGVLAGHGTPMRRLIESGAVLGRNFVQVGLRGYWPPVETFDLDAGQRAALAPHERDRGARRRGGGRRRDRRSPRRPGRDLHLASTSTSWTRAWPRARARPSRAVSCPRAAPGHPPHRRRGGPRRDGHRRGLAAVRPCRDHVDDRQPRGARGDLARSRRSGRPGHDPLRSSGARHGCASTAEARALARLYDVDLVEDPGDLDLTSPWRANRRPDPRARRRDGPARGPARGARPRRHRGRPRSGDARAGARRAAAQMPNGPGRVDLVEGDLLDPPPRCGSYALAFIALNTLFLLATRERQRAAIAVLADHLAPDGLAAVDVWLPEADDLVAVRRPDDLRVRPHRSRDGAPGDQGRRRATTPRPASST